MYTRLRLEREGQERLEQPEADAPMFFALVSHAQTDLRLQKSYVNIQVFSMPLTLLKIPNQQLGIL